MSENKTIDDLFPPDPDISEAEIERALQRPNYAARIAVGGALAASASVAGLKLWRHFHPYSGVDHDDD